MEYNFEECISGIIETSTVVQLDEKCIDRINVFAEKIVKRKRTEQHHRVDNQKEIKRFVTGLKGEAALEKLLKIEIINWTIGDSEQYHNPDIPGYNIGIKTVEYGKFPIIFKDNYYPQIICVSDINSPNIIYICGLATVNVLNEFQDDSLILDSRLRVRGTKTGFYGFDYLEPVSNLYHLEKYKKMGRRYETYYKELENRKCPKCGMRMIIKEGMYGEFWGCKGYPKCKYTESITNSYDL